MATGPTAIVKEWPTQRKVQHDGVPFDLFRAPYFSLERHVSLALFLRLTVLGWGCVACRGVTDHLTIF